MIELQWPWMLLLLPLPIVVWLMSRGGDDNQQGALYTHLFNQWSDLQTSAANSVTIQTRSILKWLIWILLVIAAARPAYVGEPIKLPSQGRELLLAVDVSGSMKERDMTLLGKRVNRLELVKHVLQDFIDRRVGDRLGLILFGEQAYLQSPLTFDRETVKQYLNESALGIAGNNGTAIGDAIGMAIKRYKDKELSNRVLVLLTDGQNTMGVDPIEATEFALEKSITVYTIGIGAGPQVVRDGFFGPRRINPSQDLDEKTLTKIAQMSGGQYFRGRNQKELEGIYRELDRLVPVEAEQQVFRPTKLLFYIPLALSTLLFLILYAWPLLTRFRSLNQANHFEKEQSW